MTNAGGTGVGEGRAKRTPAERAAFRRRAAGRTFKVLATVAVVYFIILNIPGLRNAV